MINIFSCKIHILYEINKKIIVDFMIFCRYICNNMVFCIYKYLQFLYYIILYNII